MSLYQKNYRYLTERFPEFHLHSLFPQKKIPFPQKKPFDFPKKIHAETVFIFDTNHGEGIEKWIKTKSFQTVLIYTDLSYLQATLHNAKSNLFTQKNIFFYFLDSTDPHAVDLLFHRYGFSTVSYVGIKEFDSLKKAMQKKHAVIQAQIAESLHSGKIWKNNIRNLHNLPHSYRLSFLKGFLRNAPAVLCGAGPSIEPKFLQAIGQKAYLFACGSSIRPLTSGDNQIDFGVICDPNPLEYSRLKETQFENFILFYSLRVFYQIFSLPWKRLCYIDCFDADVFERIIQKDLFSSFPEEPIFTEAFSVVSLGLQIAMFLGCNPIFLSGIDLAYVDQRKYMDGVTQDNQAPNTPVTGKSHKNTLVSTKAEWLLEAEALGKYIQSFPNVTVYQIGPGLKIEGTQHITYSEAKKLLEKTIDKKAIGPFNDSLHLREKVQRLSQKMEASLKELYQYTKIIAEEIHTNPNPESIDYFSPKALVTWLDMQEIFLSKVFLKPFYCLKKILASTRSLKETQFLWHYYLKLLEGYFKPYS